MKRIDLTGHKKGRLTVLSFSHSHVQPSGQKRAVWNVVCECGTTKKMSTANLTSGATISCGCYKSEGLNKKEHGVSSFNHKYGGYKARARLHKKNIPFDLTKEEFKAIVLQNCHYCGIESSSVVMAKPTANGAFVSNGIDRVDSSKGYVKENCVPCCTRCNWMKNEMPYEDFLLHIKRIFNYAIAKK
jgi:hypothetical protein